MLIDSRETSSFGETMNPTLAIWRGYSSAWRLALKFILQGYTLHLP